MKVLHYTVETICNYVHHDATDLKPDQVPAS